jgi:pyrroline-5-carboxylate reductase
MINKNLGIIGIGHMGSSIAKIIINKNLWCKEKLILCDGIEEKLENFKAINSIYLTTDPRWLAQKADILVIAVRPQEMKSLLTALKTVLKKNTLIISVASGITMQQITAWSACQQIIRAMPNLPVGLGYGMIGWTSGSDVSKKTKHHFKQLIRHLGQEIYFRDESGLDIITALSGSGPMYFAYLTSILAKVGEKMGLSLADAKKISLQTMLGASIMLSEYHLDPEEFVSHVASKGGTTEKALAVFQDQGMEKIIENAVQSAFLHSAYLQKLSEQRK